MMAAPGLGIGDIVNACMAIYDLCMKYKDAPKEFEEIADKAKSTNVVLERIQAEACMKGNLVARAGPQGFSQLEDHLKGLRADCRKLESLVTKYDKIHDEGAGRRLLFTLKESGGLTDLRRRIGLHEQMLQLWYMTLVYSSLRRLESGQKGILCAIEAINKWGRSTLREIQQSLREGDVKPLERELCKSGLEPQVVNAALGTAVDYVRAPPLERVRIESHARSSAAVHPEASTFQPPRSGTQEFFYDTTFSYDRPPYPPPPPKPHTHRRSRSSSQQPPYFSQGTEKDDGENVTDEDSYVERYKSSEKAARKSKRDARDKHKVEKSLKEEKPSKGYDTTYLTPDFGRPRSSSQTTKPTPPSPFLIIPDTIPHHHHRPASYHDPSDQYDRLSPNAGTRYKQEQFITITRTPQRHRSVSRETDPVDRDRRNLSTHSYVRRRSSSRGNNGEEST
ncbi:hypothetical protein BDR22DRAFT_876793 [Usnea florida]